MSVIMNPYSDLSINNFWKTGVSIKSFFDINDLWSPKFEILPKHKISTFGSCFAQHIGRALIQRGFKWYNTEPAPTGMSEKSIINFNYNVFSSRTGNIYTTSLLKQWVEWSTNVTDIPEEVWFERGRYIDPFRPRIEPNGFASLEELRQSQQQTSTSFNKCITESDFFVYTLGLTESWFNKEFQYEYPMCPGTAAGDFNPDSHEFLNQQFNFVLKNLIDAISLMRNVNPNLKFILTVSPVPLTATYTNKHILIASMESKSILRAVAGQLAQEHEFIDYFPSYETINSPVFRGSFFEPNLRNVNPYGVNFVMDSFFSSLINKFGPYNKSSFKKDAEDKISFDEVCEEEILSSFSGNFS